MSKPAPSATESSPAAAASRESSITVGANSVNAPALPSGQSFYLVLVGAGLAVFLLSELFGALGLRSRKRAGDALSTSAYPS